jgi:hypothetical protein
MMAQQRRGKLGVGEEEVRRNSMYALYRTAGSSFL